MVPGDPLLGVDILVVALPQSHQQAVIVGVEELVAGDFRAVVIPGGALTLRRKAVWSDPSRCTL